MWKTLNPDGVDILDEKSYGSSTKIICLTLFVSFGFLGSSCAGAITKQFGALSMSITSTVNVRSCREAAPCDAVFSYEEFFRR